MTDTEEIDQALLNLEAAGLIVRVGEGYMLMEDYIELSTEESTT